MHIIATGCPYIEAKKHSNRVILSIQPGQGHTKTTGQFFAIVNSHGTLKPEHLPMTGGSLAFLNQFFPAQERGLI